MVEITVPSPVHTVAASIQPSPQGTPSPLASPSPTLLPSPSAVSTAAAKTPVPDEQLERTVIAEGFYYVELNDALKARITGMSYPAKGESCKISYADLRYIHLLYVDFEGVTQEGELMVNAKLAQEVTEIFYALYQAEYPLASVRLVDDYGEPGDDNLSMADNNTSGFNYRRVTGSSTLSRHSYGAAIDINPRYNPYINGDRISPANGAQYADRSLEFPGKIDHDDLCYQLFTAHGWSWGGDWDGDKDYQHFSKAVS